eukprot:GHVL01009424.1.p1 GENE.GHVL01009424.1~~GHVL01009424.1.p1  ORF type:complete len:919 (-),score=100.57 GHVL01009424.1:1892-4648(-)
MTVLSLVIVTAFLLEATAKTHFVSKDDVTIIYDEGIEFELPLSKNVLRLKEQGPLDFSQFNGYCEHHRPSHSYECTTTETSENYIILPHIASFNALEHRIKLKMENLQIELIDQNISNILKRLSQSGYTVVLHLKVDIVKVMALNHLDFCFFPGYTKRVCIVDTHNLIKVEVLKNKISVMLQTSSADVSWDDVHQRYDGQILTLVSSHVSGRGFSRARSAVAASNADVVVWVVTASTSFDRLLFAHFEIDGYQKIHRNHSNNVLLYVFWKFHELTQPKVVERSQEVHKLPISGACVEGSTSKGQWVKYFIVGVDIPGRINNSDIRSLGADLSKYKCREDSILIMAGNMEGMIPLHSVALPKRLPQEIFSDALRQNKDALGLLHLFCEVPEIPMTTAPSGIYSTDRKNCFDITKQIVQSFRHSLLNPSTDCCDFLIRLRTSEIKDFEFNGSTKKKILNVQKKCHGKHEKKYSKALVCVKGPSSQNMFSDHFNLAAETDSALVATLSSHSVKKNEGVLVKLLSLDEAGHSLSAENFDKLQAAFRRTNKDDVSSLFRINIAQGLPEKILEHCGARYQRFSTSFELHICFGETWKLLDEMNFSLVRFEHCHGISLKVAMGNNVFEWNFVVGCEDHKHVKSIVKAMFTHHFSGPPKSSESDLRQMVEALMKRDHIMVFQNVAQSHDNHEWPTAVKQINKRVESDWRGISDTNIFYEPLYEWEALATAPLASIRQTHLEASKKCDEILTGMGHTKNKTSCCEFYRRNFAEDFTISPKLEQVRAMCLHKQHVLGHSRTAIASKRFPATEVREMRFPLSDIFGTVDKSHPKRNVTYTSAVVTYFRMDIASALSEWHGQHQVNSKTTIIPRSAFSNKKKATVKKDLKNTKRSNRKLSQESKNIGKSCANKISVVMSLMCLIFISITF